MTGPEIARLMVSGPLDDQDRCLVVLLAAIVHHPDSAALAVGTASHCNVPREAAVEMALQSYLFAGFPRCINALSAIHRVYGAEEPPPPARHIEAEDLSRWRRRGEALFRRIYAEHADKVLGDLTRFHEDLEDWILVEAYGKILAREQVPPKIRELAASAALIVSGDLRQLSSHLRGALRCGATEEELWGTYQIGVTFASEELAHEVRGIVQRVVEQRG